MTQTPTRSAVGILGLGSIGLRHAQNLIARGVEVAGYDPEEKRRSMLAQLGGQPADTREAVLKGARAVVIASPSVEHFRDLRDAVSTGCHVLVEKPIAVRTEEVANVLADAANKKLEVFCGFNLRFHPCVAEAKIELDSGAIGRVLRASIECGSYLPDWRPGTDYRKGYAADPVSGGVIFDVIHEIDLALYLLGDARVDSASAACTGLLDIPSDDIADFVLLHKPGARSAIHVDYLTRPSVRQTRIVGTNGCLEIDLLKRKLTRFALDGKVAREATFEGSFANDYVAEIGAFLDRMEGRVTSGATGENGLNALEVALDVRRLAGLPQQ